MRTIVRAGLSITVVAVLALLATIEPDLAGAALRHRRWPLLGVGMGLIASQLGNVVQSSVDASGRGEAGGLQYTGQQLGSSLGVALIGAIVLDRPDQRVRRRTIEADERISDEVAAQVSVAVEPGIDFVAADEVEAAAAGGRPRRGHDRRDRRRLRGAPSSSRSRPACWPRRSSPSPPSRSPGTCPTPTRDRSWRPPSTPHRPGR